MRRFACFLPLLLAALGACTNDPVQPEKGVTVVARNLPPTDDDFYYKLWFSYPAEGAIDKQPHPDHWQSRYFAVGNFRVGATGELTGINGGAAGFIIPEGYSPALVADAILTVERTIVLDTTVGPGPVLLAGEFVGTAEQGIDTLTLSGSHAFGSRMAKVVSPTTTHRFVLDTPTTPADEDFAMGVWFVTLQSGVFEPSLDLPPLPLISSSPAWEYESWLVDNSLPPTAEGHYIPLGRFTYARAADRTGAGPGAGSNAAAAYPAPGEDFTGASSRTLTSGTYGLIVSLQLSGLSLDRPFVPLLKRQTIPTGLGQLQPDTLAAETSLPRLEVRIER